MYDDAELYDKFRFRRHDILAIVDELREDLEYPDTRQGSLPATLQVLVALRMYATGCFQNLVAETIGIDQSTASRTIHRVTNALVARMQEWVHSCRRNNKPTSRRPSSSGWQNFPTSWDASTGPTSASRRLPPTNMNT